MGADRAVPSGLIDVEFWRDRRVLVTGHTGFKGSWLSIWLHQLGAHVTGIALAPETSPNLFDLAGVETLVDKHHLVDIRDFAPLREAVLDAKPEIVIHMAAQSLVRQGFEQPRETFETNVMGSVNLLQALVEAPTVKAVVMVTTDKVYQDESEARPYSEAHTLGGDDPYGGSKAASELVVKAYRSAFFTPAGVGVATARAGNVIGGGDWSRDRLIPDAVRSWQCGETLSVRHPEAVRPWQHVLEPLAGYLVLAEHLADQTEVGHAVNFGPDQDCAVPVREVIELCQSAWGDGTSVVWGSDDDGPKETGTLTLDASYACRTLGVKPRWSLEVAVERTIAWYRAYVDGGDARTLCVSDSDSFGMME